MLQFKGEFGGKTLTAMGISCDIAEINDLTGILWNSLFFGGLKT